MNAIERAIRELAEQFPDNKYLNPLESCGCLYEEGFCSNGSQGCIVGQAIKHAGFTVPVGADNMPLGKLLRDTQPNISSDEVSWVRSVQYLQDRKYTWGEAVAITDGRTTSETKVLT